MESVDGTLKTAIINMFNYAKHEEKWKIYKKNQMELQK